MYTKDAINCISTPLCFIKSLMNKLTNKLAKLAFFASFANLFYTSTQ